MTALQEFVNGYGLRISKEELVSKAYYKLIAEHDVVIVNERYIKVDGIAYQLIKSRKRNAWLVKEI